MVMRPRSPTICWKARKASGIIQSWYERLRTQGAGGIIPSLRPETLLIEALESKDLRIRNSSVGGQEKGNIPAQEEKIRFYPSFTLFVLFGPSGS